MPSMHSQTLTEATKPSHNYPKINHVTLFIARLLVSVEDCSMAKDYFAKGTIFMYPEKGVRQGKGERRNMKVNVRKTLIAIGIVLLFAVGLMLLGMFIDIQIVLRYDYTPISFTFTLLFIGAVIGLLLAFKTIRSQK